MIWCALVWRTQRNFGRHQSGFTKNFWRKKWWQVSGLKAACLPWRKSQMAAVFFLAPIAAAPSMTSDLMFVGDFPKLARGQVFVRRGNPAEKKKGPSLTLRVTEMTSAAPLALGA